MEAGARFAFLILITLVFFSCRKKDDPVVNPAPDSPADTATAGEPNFQLRLNIQNMAGNQPLELEQRWYVTENGDSIQINEYKYYLSNFTLIGDSVSYSEPESYYLIDQKDVASRSFTIDSIPAGHYKKISFLIGVNHERNTSGAQTGALDPMHEMFWDWNTGYIMAKLEGLSPQAGTFQGRIAYHIAGFSGMNSVLRTVTLEFPAPVEIKDGTIPRLAVKADILEWFRTPNLIKINELPVIGNTGPEAAKMAANYADMFTIVQIEP